MNGDLFVDASAAAVRRYRLTSREGQVLEALLRGHERTQIAEAMAVTAATVKWHLHNLYRKLGVESSEAALRKALSLDDPQWLHASLQQREAFERLVAAAEQVVRIGRISRQTRLGSAVARLERELASARLEAPAAESTRATGDERVVMPITDPRQLELPGSSP
jgi:DNA-binding CsgD family transcriptional regulator